MPKPRRYWDDAIAKRDREGRCRVCNAEDRIQAAHTIARKDQDKRRYIPNPEYVGPVSLTARTNTELRGGAAGGGKSEFLAQEIENSLLEVLYVNPDSIVPLCQGCHYKYDDRKLDLLPHLTREEEANAALAVGLIAATRRLTSGGYE